MNEGVTGRALSLHHLVAPDASPCELVRIAAELGCRHVCLFTQDPGVGMAFPIVTDTAMPELLQCMSASGVTALGLAAFALSPDTDVAAYQPALERGARLGGAVATIRVADADEGRAIDRFAAFAELCADHAIVPSIEFMGFGAKAALAQAVHIVRAAGRGTIAVDALHMVRTGTSLADLRRLDRNLIGLVQLCDGPLRATAEDYMREGPFDRLLPGEGEFPLRQLLDLTPECLPVSLEVPCTRWQRRGVSAHERARRVVTASAQLLATVEPQR